MSRKNTAWIECGTTQGFRHQQDILEHVPLDKRDSTLCSKCSPDMAQPQHQLKSEQDSDSHWPDFHSGVIKPTPPTHTFLLCLSSCCKHWSTSWQKLFVSVVLSVKMPPDTESALSQSSPTASPEPQVPP